MALFFSSQQIENSNTNFEYDTLRNFHSNLSSIFREDVQDSVYRRKTPNDGNNSHGPMMKKDNFQ